MSLTQQVAEEGPGDFKILNVIIGHLFDASFLVNSSCLSGDIPLGIWPPGV